VGLFTQTFPNPPPAAGVTVEAAAVAAVVDAAEPLGAALVLEAFLSMPP
jgi:hypothetical protein